MSTWAKVCQALGSNFEPYLQQVMPLVFHSAAVRADMSVIGTCSNNLIPTSPAHPENFILLPDPEVESTSEKEGFEVIEMQGKRIEIKTASLDEKCTAFDVLLVVCRVMGQSFTPYLSPSLHLAIPALKFLFHDGVRETAALYETLLPSLRSPANVLIGVTCHFYPD